MRAPSSKGDWLGIVGFFALLIFLAGAWLKPTNLPPANSLRSEFTPRINLPTSWRLATHEPKPLVVKLASPSSDAEAEQDADYRERKNTDQWLVWWAGFAVIVEIIQAFGIIASFSIAAFVAIRQLRAYVVVSALPLTQFAVGQNIKASFFVENVGATPAYDLFHLSGVQVIFVGPGIDPPEFPARSWRDASRLNSKRFLLAKPSSIEKASHTILTQQEFDAVTDANPTARVMIYGAVYYRDIFRFKRMTSFTLSYTGGAGSVAGYYDTNNYGT